MQFLSVSREGRVPSRSDSGIYKLSIIHINVPLSPIKFNDALLLNIINDQSVNHIQSDKLTLIHYFYLDEYINRCIY